MIREAIAATGKALLGIRAAPADAVSVAECETELRERDSTLESCGIKLRAEHARLATALERGLLAERALADGGDGADLDPSHRAVIVAKHKLADAQGEYDRATQLRDEAKGKLIAARAREAEEQSALDLCALRGEADLLTLQARSEPLALRFWELAEELAANAQEMQVHLAATNDARRRLAALTGERHPAADGSHIVISILEELVAREVIGAESVSVIAGDAGPNGALDKKPGHFAQILLTFAKEPPQPTSRTAAARRIVDRLRAHPTHESARQALLREDAAAAAAGYPPPPASVVHVFSQPLQPLPIRGGTR